jgi:hypothetical protein
MPDFSYPRQITRQILSDPNTFATTMVVVLADVYGLDFIQWSPETIRMETEEDFNFEWETANFDRLMAGVTLLKTDVFYKSLPDFVDLCNILAGAPATPGVFDPADASECAWGITEALLLSPPDRDEPFSEEIRAYIGKVVEMEGIITPPDILRIGLTDQGKKLQVQSEYSDDPVMYSAIWNMEASKTAEINELVKVRLTLLVNQLGSLQLQNGKTAELANKMLTNLNTKPEEGSPLV